MDYIFWKKQLRFIFSEKTNWMCRNNVKLCTGFTDLLTPRNGSGGTRIATSRKLKTSVRMFGPRKSSMAPDWLWETDPLSQRLQTGKPISAVDVLKKPLVRQKSPISKGYTQSKSFQKSSIYFSLTLSWRV